MLRLHVAWVLRYEAHT